MPGYDSSKIAGIHRHLHSELPSESALRVKALESLVVDKGLVSSETLDAWEDAFLSTPHGRPVRLKDC